jgi:hypothetical protein
MEKIRIRDKHFGSGINIPDPQHCDTHTNKESEVAGSGVSSPGTLADTRLASIRYPYLFIRPSQSPKISLKIRNLIIKFTILT